MKKSKAIFEVIYSQQKGLSLRMQFSEELFKFHVHKLTARKPSSISTFLQLYHIMI